MNNFNNYIKNMKNMEYLFNIINNHRTLYFRKCLENAKNRIKNSYPMDIMDIQTFRRCEVCSNTTHYNMGHNCWFCGYNILIDMKILYNIIIKNRYKPKLPNFKLLDSSQFHNLTFRDLVFICNIYGILVMDNSSENMINNIIKSSWDITMQELTLYNF